MRLVRTLCEPRVSGRLKVGRNCWSPSEADRIEQEIACLAADSDRFDRMSDEQWCNYLERQSDAGN